MEPKRDDSEIVLLRKIVECLGGDPACCGGSTEQELLFQWAQLACAECE